MRPVSVISRTPATSCRGWCVTPSCASRSAISCSTATAFTFSRSTIRPWRAAPSGFASHRHRTIRTRTSRRWWPPCPRSGPRWGWGRHPEAAMTIHAAGSAELQRTQARVWFERLRDDICAAIEALEQQAPLGLFPDEPARFAFKPWTRKSGEGGGVGGFLKNGRLFEKAGIHTSSANGVLTPELAKTLPGGGQQLEYVSTSISLIIHPRSPCVPTVHMNTRFLATSQGWFGGGADLTPMLGEQRSQQADDAVAFHDAMLRACDAHDAAYYPKFKAWADEYFFLPHRGVTRGVGGIF